MSIQRWPSNNDPWAKVEMLAEPPWCSFTSEPEGSSFHAAWPGHSVGAVYRMTLPVHSLLICAEVNKPRGIVLPMSGNFRRGWSRDCSRVRVLLPHANSSAITFAQYVMAVTEGP